MRGMTQHRSLPIFLAASLLTLCFGALAPSGAAAQRGTSWAPRLYIDGQLGLFGDVHVHSDNSDATDGLEPSGGGVIGIDVPVVPVFSLGAELGFTVWNSQGGRDWEIGPSGLLYLSFVPRLRIPFGDGDAGQAHGALYLAALIGPSLSFPSSDIANGLSAFGASIDTGAGLHGGGLVGLQLFFSRSIGIDLGAGYQHHVVWHHMSGFLGGTNLQVDLGQLIIRAGLAIAL